MFAPFFFHLKVTPVVGVPVRVKQNFPIVTRSLCKVGTGLALAVTEMAFEVALLPHPFVATNLYDPLLSALNVALVAPATSLLPFFH
jgi:hypothetical protein